jgi:hypothetical protein
MDVSAWIRQFTEWVAPWWPRPTVLSAVLTTVLVLLIALRFTRKRPVRDPRDLAPHERRSEPRSRVDAMSVHISDADLTAEQLPGTIVDCSVSGLGLRTEQAVAVGRIISVRPVNVPNSTVWALAEVKHCTAIAAGWKVGCRFIRTPPWVAPLLAPAGEGERV